MTTGAFSRNVGKLFSELKLVPDNLYAEANWEAIEKKPWTELSHILLTCNVSVSSENKKTDPPSVCSQLFAETYGSNL